MGHSSSIAGRVNEGAYFADLVNPPVPTKTALKSSVPKDQSTDSHQKKKVQCWIDPRAIIIKKLSWEVLWEKFLSSTCSSFALSSSEASALLKDCIAAGSSSEDGSATIKSTIVDSDIEKYVQMIETLEEQSKVKNPAANPSGAKVVDFMALCSSVLLLSSTPFEDKIDQLFKWIVLNENGDFGFPEFLVAMSSFERGLSNAMGQPACSETYVKKVASDWLALADPAHKGVANPQTRISCKEFFDFCSNRQHIVRKMLEILSASEVREDKNTDITSSEAVTMISSSSDEEIVATGGDEWMANPAWKKTAQRMVPATLQPNSSKPSTTLSLEWVHGYRGFDCRNNVAYLNDEGTQLFFHAAALGVVQDSNGAQDTSKWQQHFFGEHTDDIISMSVYQNPDGKSALIATGEVGKTPAVHIYEWRDGTFAPLAAVRGFHSKGVCQLAFSKDGKSLFSIGVEYSVAVIHTDQSKPSSFGKMAISSQGPKDKVLSCTPVGKEGGDFVSCGDKHAMLWKRDIGCLVQVKTELYHHKNKMYMCVVAGCYNSCVTGTSDGDVIVLCTFTDDKGSKHFIPSEPNKIGTPNKNCVKVGGGAEKKGSASAIEAHQKAVNAMWSNSTGNIIVTGGAEGSVIIWNLDNTGTDKSKPLAFNFLLTKISEFTIFGSAPIRTLCLSNKSGSSKLLVGTMQSEVMEFDVDGHCKSLTNRRVLVSGHFKDELWGLAVRPYSAESPETNGEYCTVGDDGYLRIWSIQNRRQLSCLKLGGLARCCAYSPDGQYIAVGFGGNVGKGKKNKEDGTVRVYRTWKGPTPAEHKPITEFKEAKAFISCVKFSPDGATLAVGARDNCIYLYSVAQQFKRKAKFSKHNAGILFFDFTADGKFLQSCCSGYEILFSDTTTGVQLTNGATLLTEAEWASWTVTLGWATIGIWGGGMDGTDINAADRSPSGKLLAVADDFGKIKVFRYPCTQEGAQCNLYSGHSSHVTSARWASLHQDVRTKVLGDDYLISVGGNDKCVFQWKNSGTESSNRISSTPLDDEVDAADIELSDGGFDAGPSGGDEFTAVKPWLGSIVPPSAWGSRDSKEQKDKEIQFVTAIGEMSAKHGGLTAVHSPEKQATVYAEVQAAAQKVMKLMNESGIADSSAPASDELELEWVHGYRGHDCRNNVFYSGSTHVIYHAAALCVSVDLTKNTQKYFRGHTDDILSMAVRQQTDGVLIVATGQQGVGNTYVWDAASMKTLSVLQTKQKSINMLEFSKADGGRLLISIAEDKTVAVADWRSQTILASTKGEAAVTHQIAAGSRPGTPTFLSVGEKHLKLWTLSGRNLTSTKVLLGKTKLPTKPTGAQTYWCVAEARGCFFIGAEDSYVYVTKECKELQHSFPAAAMSNQPKGFGITSIVYSEDQKLLICGAKDGTVSGFSLADDVNPLTITTPKFRFNVSSLLLEPHQIMAKQINALHVRPSSDSDIVLLVSTRGCDMLQVAIDDGAARLYNKSGEKSGAILQRAHCNDELWGVATHPTKPEYVTVGDDKTLRFFCIKDKKMLRVVPLGLISRTVCYGLGGNILAVGFGGRVGKGRDAGGGVVRLYSSEHSAVDGSSLPIIKLAEAKDAKEWISDIKFSADGRVMCVGAHDCKIYIYRVDVEMTGSSVKSAKLTLSKTFTKHNSVINHLDLSADGRFMQSNCSAYELLFADTMTGKQIVSASELKDVKWDSWTCTLGWPVQGIWAPGMDGSDINAVARSYSGHLVATSDDFGKIRLFRYPCMKENSSSQSYSGHSSHVTNVRWSAADECLISTGGNDKCVMQWRHVMSAGSTIKMDGADDLDEFAINSHTGKDIEGSADMTLTSGGDESGCVKPWLGAVRTPKNPPPVNPAAPAVSVKLKWVHGYTSGTAGSNKSRVSNNLFYSGNCNPVFPAAALGICMTKESNDTYTQKYFMGHNDDILCLAISPDRRFVATGQTASKGRGKGSICVWDVQDCRQLCRMDACHQRGVAALAFSPEGNELISVGQDDKNTHILWKDAGGSWSRVQKTAEAPSDQNAVLFLRWLSSDAQRDSDGIAFVSGGAQAINFWKLEGATLVKKTGRFGSKKQAPLLCAANIQNKTKDQKTGWLLVVGTATGDLYLYGARDREAIQSVEKAHTGSVLSLCEGNRECTFLVSGGKDKMVRVWNQALQRVSNFDLTKFSAVDAAIAAVDVRPLRNAKDEASLVILAGTYGGEICEISSNPEKEGSNKNDNATGASISSKNGAASAEVQMDNRNMDLADAQCRVLLHSHYSGELWGCAPHPTDRDLFATVGDDATLRLWSVSQNKPLAQINIGWPGRSVCWHPGSLTDENGLSLLAVGFHEAVKGGVAKKKPTGSAKTPASAIKKVSKVDPKFGQPSDGPTKMESEDAAGKALPAAHDKAIQIYALRMTNAGQWVLEEKARGCDSAAWIGDIKWSPGQGSLLAAGSHDKKLYAFDFPDMTDVQHIKNTDSTSWEKYWSDVAKCLAKPKFVYNKHSSSVNHFDFSLDCRFLQSNCQAGELLFAETGLVADERDLLNPGKQVTSATAMAEYNAFIEDADEAEKGQSWATQTCTLGWPVQGIWAPGSDTTDINACDRSSGQGKLVATADDFGAIKLFRYPAVHEGSKSVDALGHSSHVTNVRFTIANDMISVGGNDRCVFVWQITEN